MFIPHFWAAVLPDVLQGTLHIGWQRKLRPHGAEQTHHVQSGMGSWPMAPAHGLVGNLVGGGLALTALTAEPGRKL